MDFAGFRCYVANVRVEGKYFRVGESEIFIYKIVEKIGTMDSLVIGEGVEGDEIVGKKRFRG